MRRVERGAPRGDVLGILWVLCFALLFLSPALKDGPSFAPADLGSTLSTLTAGSVPLSSNCVAIAAPAVAHCAHNGINGDQITQSIPWAYENWLLVHHGELPLWNDLSGTGMPQLLNFESASYSLPSLASYLVPERLAFLMIVLMKLLIYGIGAYVLARMLSCEPLSAAFAGTTAMLSGSFAGWLGWSISGTVCWTAWIAAGLLWAYREPRRTAPIALCAISIAFSIFGGFPEGMVIEAIALLAMIAVAGVVTLVGKRHLDLAGVRRMAVGSVLGLMLGAPLWLCGLSVLKASIRTNEVAGRGIALHGAALLFAQGYDGLPISGSAFFATDIPNYFETAAYVGIIAVLFMLVALWRAIRRPMVAGIAVAGLVSFLLAYRIGNPGIVQSLIRHLGVVSLVTSRSLPILGLCVALLAAIGLQRVIDTAADPATRRTFAVALGICAALLAALGAKALGGGLSPTASALRRESLYWPVAEIVLIALFAMLLFDPRIALPERMRRILGHPGRAFAAGALLAQSAFLLFAGVGINSYARSEFPMTPGISQLQELVGQSLVALDAGNASIRQWLGDGLYPEMNIGYGIDELAVHDPVAPKALFTSWPVVGAGQLTAGVNLFVPSVDSVALARRYGAGFILVAAGQPLPKGVIKVAAIDHAELVRVPGAARFVATGAEIVGTAHQSDTSYVVSLRSTTRGASLVAHVTASPGWSATENGVALPLSVTDGVAYVARLAKGTSSVTFTYRPPHLVLAGVLFLLALAGLVVDAQIGRRKRALGLWGRAGSVEYEPHDPVAHTTFGPSVADDERARHVADEVADTARTDPIEEEGSR